MAHYSRRDLDRIFTDKIKEYLDIRYFINTVDTNSGKCIKLIHITKDGMIDSNLSIQMIVEDFHKIIICYKDWSMSGCDYDVLAEFYSIGQDIYPMYRFYTDDKEEYECFKEELNRIYTQLCGGKEIEPDSKVEQYKENWSKCFGFEGSMDLESFYNSLYKKNQNKAMMLYYTYFPPSFEL